MESSVAHVGNHHQHCVLVLYVMWGVPGPRGGRFSYWAACRGDCLERAMVPEWASGATRHSPCLSTGTRRACTAHVTATLRPRSQLTLFTTNDTIHIASERFCLRFIFHLHTHCTYQPLPIWIHDSYIIILENTYKQYYWTFWHRFRTNTIVLWSLRLTSFHIAFLQSVSVISWKVTEVCKRKLGRRALYDLSNERARL